MVADNMSESDFSMQGDGPPGSGSMSPPLGAFDQMMGVPHHPGLFCSRKQREFTPDSKKDDTYWDRRRRNNAAAKRSREKRRLNDMLLEKRVVQLARENHILRAQVTSVYKSYGIRAETLIDMDQVLATLPTEDQLLQSAGCPVRSVSPPPPLTPTMTMTIGISPHHNSERISERISESPEHPHQFDDIYRQQFTQHREQQRQMGSPSSSNGSGSGSERPSTSSVPASTTSGSGQVSPVQIGSPRQEQSNLPQQLAVDFSKRPETDDDDRDSVSTSVPGSKRSYTMAWAEHERNTSSASPASISCDDPINLTTSGSRSRSNSENEDDLRHHIPHKMRYKYLQHTLGTSPGGMDVRPRDKEEY